MNQFINLFPSRSFVAVLSTFLTHPNEDFYQASISKSTGCGLIQVQRALKRLELTGLVKKTRSGNRVYYHANQMHPAFEDIKRVLMKTILFGDLLKESLAKLESKIQFSFIYGSIAKGTESEKSDVDLFVIGDVGLRDIAGILGAISQEVHREINISTYSKNEFIKKLHEGNRFIKDVVDSSKIWIFGDKDEFEKMGK